MNEILSDTNTRLWQIDVLIGKKRDEIFERVCHALFRLSEHPEKTSNNKQILHIIQKNGFRLLLSTAVKMAQQQLRNDQFFDAPVELFFTVHLAMGISTKMDSAMMIQKTMITAKARGSDTCPQAAWNHFQTIVLNIVGAAQKEELICGIALGYMDPEQIVNRFITPRVPVEDFAVFINND